MKPYGFEIVGGYSFRGETDQQPAQPHMESSEGSHKRNKRDGRRRPRRAQRQANKKIIQDREEE